MLTFGDAKTDRSLLRVIGFCPADADFADIVNKACRKLMNRGDFIGCLEPIFLCVRNGCVVWPYYVEAVRRISWCGADVSPVNMWGAFLPRAQQSPWRLGCQWHDGSSYLQSLGRSSLYQDVLGDGRLIRAYARCAADFGKTVTIFGLDNNGQVLQHQNPDGTWAMGLIITLATPFASTAVYVRHIDYVIKDETSCPINLYGYNPVTDLLEDLAQYEPGETNPSFSRTRVLLPGGCTAGTSCNRGLAALVKLRFIPVKYDTDPIVINNLDALALEIQSIKFGEAGDRQNSKLYEADAVAELNLQLANDFPEETFVADNRIFAGRTFQNQCF